MDVAILVVDLSKTRVGDPAGTDNLGTNPVFLALGLLIVVLRLLVIEGGVLDQEGHIVTHLIASLLALVEGCLDVLNHGQHLFSACCQGIQHLVSLSAEFVHGLTIVELPGCLVSRRGNIGELFPRSHIGLKLLEQVSTLHITFRRFLLGSSGHARVEHSLTLRHEAGRVAVALIILDGIELVKKALVDIMEGLDTLAQTLNLELTPNGPTVTRGRLRGQSNRDVGCLGQHDRDDIGAIGHTITIVILVEPSGCLRTGIHLVGAHRRDVDCI